MDKLITLEAEIVADAKLIIEGAAEVKIDASESITLEIAPDTYVLGSIGSFNTAGSWVGNYVNELVRESIGTGGTLKDALDWIRTYVMDQIEIGVNQVITQVENEFVSNSTLATTLGSEIGGVRSSILDVKSTYATKTQAQAYSVDAIKASFGGDASSSAIEAYIGNIAVAKVDANSATASTVATLIASMNNQTVRIDEMDDVLVTTTGWAASASKLITAPDGSITGWEFADGSDSESEFKIHANNFSISDGTTGYTPFSIVGSDIQFNGIVSFTNVTDAPPIPDSTSDLINNSGYTTLPAVAAQGYVLPAGVANAINTNTTTINGAKITTGTVAAAQIAANTITAAQIAANTITAAQISSSYVYAGTLNANNITTGTLNADRIVSGSITSSNLVTFNIEPGHSWTPIASITTYAGLFSLVHIDLSLSYVDWKIRRNGVVIYNFSAGPATSASSLRYEIASSATYTLEARNGAGDASLFVNISGSLAVATFKK